MRSFSKASRALGAVVLAAAVAAAVASASSSRLAVGIVPPKQCGQDISFQQPDPDGVLKKLSPQIRSWYGPYPYVVKGTPWATFKGKKGPWKIGFINFPVDNPWQVNLLSELKAEFAKAKAKGLVTGSLQTYIQP